MSERTETNLAINHANKTSFRDCQCFCIRFAYNVRGSFSEKRALKPYSESKVGMNQAYVDRHNAIFVKKP